MNALRFRNFVLFLLFLRIITDRSAHDSLFPVVVPEGARFNDLVALKGVPDIGKQINDRILRPLAKANNLTGLPNFTEMEKWGGARLGADRLSRLIAIFESPGLDFSGTPDDAASLYLFLLDRYAIDSGEEASQHTPAEVRRVVTGVVGIGDADADEVTTVFDPVCGSGSLLLTAASMAGSRNDLKILLFGQDKDVSSVCTARMNMIVHGYFTARIRWGNTLTNPLFRDGTGLKTFNYVVAHPPFFDAGWTALFDPWGDPYQRFAGYGVPPRENGDYAYLLAVLHSLDSAGQGACILPFDALSRGSSEAAIRRALIRRGLIKGIISLPHNLFAGVEGGACIIVLDKGGAGQRDGIFMIDASRGFMREDGKNRLRPADVKRITDAFSQHTEIDGFSSMVPIAEIGSPDNAYDLDVSRYVYHMGAAAQAAPVPPVPPAALPEAEAAPEILPEPAPSRPLEDMPGPARKRIRAAFRGPLPYIVAGLLILMAATAYVFLEPAGLPGGTGQPKSNVDIRTQIERSLSARAAAQALKQHHPQDYEGLLKAIESDLFLGLPMETALTRSVLVVSDVKRREVKDYGMASVETLRQDLRARLPIMRHLQTAYGPRACNELAVNGAPAMQRFLGERYLKDAQLLDMTDDLAARFLNTAAEGKRLQLIHKEPGAADWQAVAQQLLSSGMKQEDFVVFAEPAKSIENPAACDVFIKLIDVLTTPGSQVSTSLIPFMAAAAAAEQ